MHQCASASKREKQLIPGLPLFGCVSILVARSKTAVQRPTPWDKGGLQCSHSNPVPLLPSIQWNLQTRLRPPFTPGQATALLDLIEVLTALCINSVQLLLAPPCGMLLLDLWVYVSIALPPSRFFSLET
jgi:hypothetical protein